MKQMKKIFFAIFLVLLFANVFADVVPFPIPSPTPLDFGITTIVVFGVLFVLNMFIEMIVVSIIAFFLKMDFKKVLLATFVGNLITHPIVFFGSQAVPLLFIFVLPVLEVFAVVFEMLVLKFFVKEISWKKAFAVSFLANVSSFVVGGIIWAVLGIFISVF
ncbi:MAG: hypothetical protein Q7K42_03735 [Candidatus Diapherotrites archaeon]|nr:hypothetical protein [Candidatus Diapherotrites archaeon]